MSLGTLLRSTWCSDAETQYDVGLIRRLFSGKRAISIHCTSSTGSIFDKGNIFSSLFISPRRCDGTSFLPRYGMRQSIVFPFATPLSLECDDPGKPLFSHRLGNRFVEGALVAYRCRSGRQLIGNSTIKCVCRGNRCQWDRAPPTKCIQCRGT